MAAVDNDRRVAAELAVVRENAGEKLPEGGDACAAARGDAADVGRGAQNGCCAALHVAAYGVKAFGVEVTLVDGDDNLRAAADAAEHIEVVRGAVGAYDTEDDLRLLYLLYGAVYARLLDVVVGGAQAGRVDHPEFGARDVERLLDGVACGARAGADDGAIVAQQRVHQRRFADIRPADDGHGYSVFHHIAFGE